MDWLRLVLYVVLGCFLLVETLGRLVRRRWRFPIPSFFTQLIDNPLRRRLIQPPWQVADRMMLEPGMTVVEVGPGKGSYTLEVSSPGTDRPLFSRQQLLMYRGRTISLKLNRKADGRRKLSGILEDVREDSVSINDAGVIYHIDLENIDKANLVWHNTDQMTSGKAGK